MFDKLNRIISYYIYEWNKIGYQLNDIFTINSDILKFISFFFIFLSIIVIVFHLWLNHHLSFSTLFKRVVVGILLITGFGIYVSKVYPDKDFYYVDIDMIEDNGKLTNELKSTLGVNFMDDSKKNTITIDGITLSNGEKGQKTFYYVYKPLNVPFGSVIENSLIKNNMPEEPLFGSGTSPIYWGVDNLQIIPYKKGNTYYLKISENSIYNPTKRKIIENLSKIKSLGEDYSNSEDNTKKEIKILVDQIKNETIKLIKLLPVGETIEKDILPIINPLPIPGSYVDGIFNDLKNIKGENKQDVSNLIKKLNKEYSTRRIDISSVFNANPEKFPVDKLDIKFGDLRIQSYYLNYVKLKDAKGNFSLLSDIKFGVNNYPVDGIVAMSDGYYPLRIGQKNSFFSRVFPEQKDTLKSDFYVKNLFFIGPVIFNNILYLINLFLFFLGQIFFLFIIFSLFPFKKSF